MTNTMTKPGNTNLDLTADINDIFADELIMSEDFDSDFVLDEIDEGEEIEMFPVKDRFSAAKRRKTDIKKKRRERNMVLSASGYCPSRGYVDYDFVDGEWVPVGKYVKYPHDSRRQRDLKRQTHKRNRQFDIDEDSHYGKGNSYRRALDYKWELD